MDKWFLINQLLAFRARERHARQPPEQKIESTLTGRKLVRIPLWTFFLLRTRPPSPDDHPERVWVMPHHTRTPWTMRKLERRASRAGDVSAATKAARRWASSRSGSRQTPPAWPRSSRGDGRTAVLRTSGSCRGRHRGSVATGAGRRRPAGRSRAGESNRLGLGAREATGGPRYYRLLLAPRTSSRVRGTGSGGSGPPAACRPFWEPSSTAGVASELARRRADRGNADFYVAPRTSFRVLGPRRLRSARNNSPGTPTDTKGPPTTTVVFNVSQNPPSGQLGPWGAKKEQKDSHNERS